MRGAVDNGISARPCENELVEIVRGYDYRKLVGVPKQHLDPNRIYEFEIFATERNGNQTITEGSLMTNRRATAALA